MIAGFPAGPWGTNCYVVATAPGTECVVIGERVDRRHLREQLSTIGSSLVVAGLHHKVRVHIHVNDPAVL